MKLLKLVSIKSLLVGLGLLVATLFAQGAKADSLDFSCGGAGGCTGTVVASGGNYSSAGISNVTGGFTGGGTFEAPGDTFTLTFDTATGAITIAEVGDPNDKFVGTITGWSASPFGAYTQILASANWSTIPSDVNGNQGVTPTSFILDLTSGGQAVSVDVPITTSSVPEPSALLLLAAGLVSLGLLLKVKGPVLA